MLRRELLRTAALLVPVAVACAPLPVAAPTPTPVPVSGGFQTPRYVPFQGPKPDIDGNANGLPPAYRTFPKQLITSVQSPPGKGGDVSILTFTNAPAPPAIDQNPAWQEVNKQIGANLKINAVGAPDYLTKLNTAIASGDIADIFYASVIGTGLQNMPDFLSSQCADLTPFLSGDAIKDFPNLAAFPSFRWPYGVFNGKLYAIPAATITGQAMLAKGKVLDENGLNRFKTADDFMSAAKQLTKPGVQYAIGGTGSGYNSWNPLGWFMGVFRVPNDWRNDGGKLTKDIETEEFKAALAFVRSLWDTGVMNPDSPSMNLTQTAAAWYAGKNILWQNNYFSFQLAWDRAKVQSQDPDFQPRIVPPFAFDGGRVTHLLGATSDSLTAFRKAPAERIRELLGVVNSMVAPFGTRENLLLNYGTEGRDFSFDANGNPALTQTGIAEVTTFPIWKMSAPPPVLFDPNDPSFAKVASDATATALSEGVASPVVGLFSKTASQKASLLNQPLTDGLYNIMFGRDGVDSLDGLVKQWRANGGDAIRTELEQALQERG
ncbi:MAG: extracellular solute-binding protein [Chloroflexi bacterium]|nr:extracellular solute-binding protein [Chloroflexota bacterium]